MGPASHPLAPAKQKKKMMAMLVLVIAAVLVIAVVAFVAMKLLGGNIKLEQYSNNNLSVLVPVGYEKTEENGGASFEEKEGEKDTRSEVIAYYEALPSGLSVHADVRLQPRDRVVRERAGAGCREQCHVQRHDHRKHEDYRHHV